MMTMFSNRGGMPSLYASLVILLSLSTVTTARVGSQYLLDEDVTASSPEQAFDFPYRINSISADASADARYPATEANLSFEISAYGVNQSEASHIATVQRDELVAWVKEVSSGNIKITRVGDARGYSRSQGRWGGKGIYELEDESEHAKSQKMQQQFIEVQASSSDLSLIETIVRSLASRDGDAVSVTRLTYALAEGDQVAPRRELRQKAMQDLMKKAKDYENDFDLRINSVEDLNIFDYWLGGSEADLWDWDDIKSRFAHDAADDLLKPSVTMQLQMSCKLITSPQLKIVHGRLARDSRA